MHFKIYEFSFFIIFATSGIFVQIIMDHTDDVDPKRPDRVTNAN